MADLFAGTGAMGIEALSRGARYCLFVDDAAASRALIRQNVEALGLTGATKIWRRDAAALGLLDTLAPFDLAFLDPPYRKDLIGPARASVAQRGAESWRPRSWSPKWRKRKIFRLRMDMTSSTTGFTAIRGWRSLKFTPSPLRGRGLCSGRPRPANTKFVEV